MAVQVWTTLRALARRRMSVAILVVLPLALYLATHDAVGRSVRSLVFGISWAVSTVAMFAALAARQVEPRLWLAGRRRSTLAAARLGALVAAALTLAAGFWTVVALDQEVDGLTGVAVDLVVTAVVAVAFGSAVGSAVRRELDGALILFFFAGLQAVVNPYDDWTRVLPFWSSRELGTWAIDGPTRGSLAAGLIHAGIVVAVAAAVIASEQNQRLRSSGRLGRGGMMTR
jgi:hypothetical protein